MKIALCNEVLHPMPFEKQCAFAAAVGFDGMELAPFTLAADPRTLTARDAAACRNALKAEGLECCALHWLLRAPDGLSITTEDNAVRQATVEFMCQLVDFAAEVGAGVLVHGSPGQRALPEGEAAAADARARAVECFARAGEAAAEAGVVYCIEPLATRETRFINTVAEAVEIVEKVGSDGLRTMIDTSATAFDGTDVPETIHRWLPGGMVRHIHVNDPNRRGPEEGALRFAPIIEALLDTGYEGWVSAEPFVYLPDGPACAARAAGVLRTLVGPPAGVSSAS